MCLWLSGRALKKFLPGILLAVSALPLYAQTPRPPAARPAGPTASAPAASATAAAQAATPGIATPGTQGKTFRVATRIVKPFVMEGEVPSRYEGFSMDLWRAIEKEIGAQSQFMVSPTVKDLLGNVQQGRAELGIAAISITAERDRTFDFSQPIYDSGLQIMVRSAGNGGTPSPLAVILSPAMLQVLGIVLLMILVPAHIIWFVERNHEDGIIENKAYFPGIFKALWWAAGTLGAQADEMPKSLIGRLVAVLWMFTGIAFVAYFTAIVTTTLTVQQLQGDIQGPDDLPGKRVATTTGSTSAKYLRSKRVQVQEYPQIEKAYEALGNKQVDAVVFDSPVLLYYAANEGSGKVQVVGSVFRRESYGIVFPTGSPYRKPINNALLKIKEDGTYEDLQSKWFGDEAGG